MTDNVRKYDCETCDEWDFSSRADWLLHLILKRHSTKARENMQTLYLQANGNLFVISELQEMDRASLLQYVAGRVPSLSNFVCFRPQANLCIIACDDGDFKELSASSQVIDGVAPKFRAYNEIPPAEWKSYFTEVNRTSSPASAAPSSRANSNSRKRIGENALHEHPKHVNKRPKLELEDDISQVLGIANGEDPNQINAKLARWTDEIAKLDEYIMMPEAELNARMTVIDDLKKRLRPLYPICELINVGGDFLGFNLDKDDLCIFFDWQGLTNPQNTSNGTIHTVLVLEADQVSKRVFDLLALPEEKGPIQSVKKCEESQIRVIYLLNDLVRMHCTLLLEPFKLVQTTLLCKQLFFMNPQSSLLVKMVVYWAMKHGLDSGLYNYYSIYWLVYFFLIQTKVMGPVIELQKSCNYQIMDLGMNVEFSYDPSLISQVAPRSSSAVAEDDILLLLNWFLYMIQTFDNVNEQSQISRSFSLVCPRFGELIDKIKFRVAKGDTTGRQFSKEQLQQWKEDLKNIGFDESTKPKLARLRLPLTLSIQHPFYIDANISLDFNGPFARRFFTMLKVTKGNLTRFLKLPVNYDSRFSLLRTLSREDSVIFPRKVTGADTIIKEEPERSAEEDKLKIPRVDSSDSNSDSEDAAGDSDEVKTEIGDIKFSLPTLDSSYLASWTSEIQTMFESVTLSDDEMTIRIAVIEGLQTILRPILRSCVLIPVGADFLGFKTEEQVFNIYLDSRGCSKPEKQIKKRIDESNRDIPSIQAIVIKRLNESPSVLEVSTDELPKKGKGGVSIKFAFIVRGQGQLKCNMLLTPFKSAETALLCKQLLMTNPQTMNLVVMMMYWVKNRKEFADCFLANPFVLLWLVYFFLIKKNILPPVLELQKSCDYEITDNPYSNVAFSYDPKIMNPTYQRLAPSVSENDLISTVELLVECFMFIDKFDNPAKGRNLRRHSVICPRVGVLIDKAEFKVCKESFRSPIRNFARICGKRGYELRKKWTENLFSLGFDKHLWGPLAKQRLRDDFVIQHPFYLSDNICCKVSGPESRAFFTAIKQTKENLTKMSTVVGTQPNVSLAEVLSS